MINPRMNFPFALPMLLTLLAATALADEPEPVGHLYGAVGDVQVRRAGNLAWEPARTSLKLFGRDAVKTGSGSGAVVQFNDETLLSVQENSLVIVVAAPPQGKTRSSALDLPSGTVLGKVGRNVDRPLEVTIRTSRGWIRASSVTRDKRGSVFNASVSASEGLHLEKSSGEISLVTKERSHPLKDGERIRIAPAPPGSAENPDQPPSVRTDSWKSTPGVSPTISPPKLKSPTSKDGSPL
jgi:hypothetical protein